MVAHRVEGPCRRRRMETSMRRVRTIRYREIADALRERVGGGRVPGRAAAAQRSGALGEYEASRVTIRASARAAQGRGAARRPTGLRVVRGHGADPPEPRAPGDAGGPAGGVGHPARAADPRLRLRRRGRPDVRAVLGIAQVLRVRRLNLADGEPFAIVTVWCPASLGAAPVPSRRRALALLRAAARAARRGQSDASAPTPPRPRTPRLLGIPPGSPVLRCERVTRTEDGEPVLVSVHVFPAYRTEFVVDMPRTEPSIAPTGLRLVE